MVLTSETLWQIKRTVGNHKISLPVMSSNFNEIYGLINVNGQNIIHCWNLRGESAENQNYNIDLSDN